MALWSPPNLPDFVIAPIREVIKKIPSHHLLPPQPDEVLDPNDAYEHLQNYAFSQGFCIVITSRDKANTYIRYACIHHGYTTRNWHQLDEHKAKQKAWFLGVTNGSHADTHNMVPNPLTYPLHAKRHPQYATQAIALRAAQISYSQATRIMATQGLSLSRNAFYNTQRTSNTIQDEGALGPLFKFLNSHNYNIRSKYHYEMDSATANPISSHLEQLFFMSDTQIRWGQ
ncbi:MAG: hypothetical protein M1840_001984 [Geoglossum simile]|nr:MAG: hypothetical protein M1840_001984 [Geoglossum simile]